MIPLAYNIRSLSVRKTSTIVTALGVGLVVFVLASAMMLIAGIKKTLAVGGRADNAIVLSLGGDDELNSNIDEPTTQTVLVKPGVKSENGAPVFVAETVVVALMHVKNDPGVANVMIRGIVPASMSFRPEARIVKGRAPQPGTDEAIIGQRLGGRFEGVQIGGQVPLKKNRVANVVGEFSAGGSSHESEIWVSREVLREVYGRQGIVSAMRVRLTGADAFPGFAAAVTSDRRLALQVVREPEFLQRQTEGLTALVGGLGGAVAFFMAIGAMIGAMITMYGAVASRQREIGTLRALGFSRKNILFSFLLEAMILTIVGGGIGVLCASGMGFVKFAMTGQSWSEVIFTFDPTAAVLIRALVAALVMGLIGGLLPAIRAARISPVVAMRG